jgi:hypothetical protein
MDRRVFRPSIHRRRSISSKEAATSEINGLIRDVCRGI